MDSDATQASMNDADRRFADRLADEVQAILGVGLLIEGITRRDDGSIELHASCLLDGQAAEVEVEAETLLEASRELIRVVAERRLNAAWTRLVAPM
jgi:hypothetical protein